MSPLVLDRAPGHVRDIPNAHAGTGTTRLRKIAGPEGAPFTILAWEFPAGTSEGPHHHQDEPIGVEHYLVTDGELVIVVDDVAHELWEGDALAIARRSMREVRNESAQPARLVLVVERLVPRPGQVAG